MKLTLMLKEIKLMIEKLNMMCTLSEVKKGGKWPKKSPSKRELLAIWKKDFPMSLPS